MGLSIAAGTGNRKGRSAETAATPSDLGSGLPSLLRIGWMRTLDELLKQQCENLDEIGSLGFGACGERSGSPSSGVSAACVMSTSVAAMVSAGLVNPRFSGVRIVGVVGGEGPQRTTIPRRLP